MKGLLAIAVTLAGALTVPTIAQAQSAITLSASSEVVGFGDSVTLSGTASGAAVGSTVQIGNDASVEVATAVTDATGAFSAVIQPTATDTYVAVLSGASSEPVTVGVRAVLSARMSPVRLFDRVRVRGVVAPMQPDAEVRVVLLASGRRVGTKDVTVRSDGGFRAAFVVNQPGRYRARASFSATDLLRGTATSRADVTPLPYLSSGSSGRFVELLEARLARLHFRLAGVRDGRYDHRTADAVVAFHKVQRMERTLVVNRATWRRLAEPLVPHARKAWRGFHFEVDQTRQVLYTVRDGSITNVLHVSTGAGGATHDGSFRIWGKTAGFSPNHLYYPSYFDGFRALHGWTEVPTYAASHGCVRIPYWNARWVYALADYGVRVVIYH